MSTQLESVATMINNITYIQFVQLASYIFAIYFDIRHLETIALNTTIKFDAYQ